MELRRVGIEESPRASGWTRLWGDVLYGHAHSSSERYWVEVPNELASALVASGDPWLAWLTPLAATIGEPLRIRVPCDATLLTGAREALAVWATWFPALTVVTLSADTLAEGVRGTRTSAFFSGGVDSYFTALSHSRDGSDAIEIDDHLFVWGLDIVLTNAPAFDRALAAVAAATTVMNRRLVPIVTNLRETRFREADWSRLSHGAALAGLGHALAGAYGTVLIPSCAGYKDLEPWGSHPLTDPMLSSSHLRIVHDGSALQRVEKTEFVARNPVALEHLRVCYRDPDGGNCGKCNKCYRTMLALEALGKLDASATFRREWLDLRRAERVYCPNSFDIREFRYILELANRVGRDDIAHAVSRSLRNSARRHRWVQRLRGLRDKPIFWRWAPGWERRLLRSWIT